MFLLGDHRMSAMNFERREWARLTVEPPLDPTRTIIDAHHHLWDRETSRFLADELLAYTRAGHHVTHTVFVECRAFYRQSGPEQMRPVGETEFVAGLARASEESGTRIASAIVSYADLTLGDAVEAVLDAHARAGDGRFRGVRHGVAWDAGLQIMTMTRSGMMNEDEFRRGVARLGTCGYSFDAWAFHPQLFELADLARSAEGTTIVLNHLGGPLHIEHYADRDAVRARWRDGMRALAACPNVVVKIGGIGMDFVFGTGWSARDRPPGSNEVVARWGDDIRWVIDTFTPRRCMFESNYPVDRSSIGYTVLWNAFQKIAAGYSEDEQSALFSSTAARVYRMSIDHDGRDHIPAVRETRTEER
jgi:predicted TIM-barrel fold metal-dependent hydrolase